MLGPRDDDCVTQNGSTMMIEDDRRLRLLLLLLRRAFSAAGCPKTLLPVAIHTVDHGVRAAVITGISPHTSCTASVQSIGAGLGGCTALPPFK